MTSYYNQIAKKTLAKGFFHVSPVDNDGHGDSST